MAAPAVWGTPVSGALQTITVPVPTGVPAGATCHVLLFNYGTNGPLNAPPPGSTLIESFSDGTNNARGHRLTQVIPDPVPADFTYDFGSARNNGGVMFWEPDQDGAVTSTAVQYGLSTSWDPPAVATTGDASRLVVFTIRNRGAEVVTEIDGTTLRMNERPGTTSWNSAASYVAESAEVAAGTHDLGPFTIAAEYNIGGIVLTVPLVGTPPPPPDPAPPVLDEVSEGNFYFTIGVPPAGASVVRRVVRAVPT